MHEPALKRVSLGGLDLVVDPDSSSIGVTVAFTDRSGGVSAAPYESLNLGLATGDDPGNVKTNRQRVASAIGVRATDIHFVRQVHGANVVDRTDVISGPLEEADGIALSGGGAAAVLAADCVPIVVVGADAAVAVHAGWRGLVAGAVEAAVGRAGNDAIAWVGPSIHACCYEVGVDVVEAFEEAGLPIADERHVDPGTAAVAALGRAGAARIAAWPECTSCTTRYFSHRRDGITGRQAGIVVRDVALQ